MHTRPRHAFLSFALSLLALSLLAGCNSDSSSDNAPAPTTQDVTVSFSAEVNDTAINCTAPLTGLGTAGSDAQLEDFRLYLSDIRVIDDQGNEFTLSLEETDFQHQGVALLDFQDKADKCTGATKPTHTAVTGSVTGAGSIQGIRFVLGIPEDMNHQNQATAPTPMNIASLFWSWQSGYKFLRADIAPVGGVNSGATTAWNIHLGSTGCTGDAALGETVTCTRPNRPSIALDGFNPASNRIRIDYSALVANSNVALDAGGAPGCMSGLTDPECTAIFTPLGLDLSTGTAGASAQTVFSVQ